MAYAKGRNDSTSDGNHVLDLIHEELHKLEYLYQRDCRINPVQKIGKVSGNLQTSAAKIRGEKESTLRDLTNVRSERHNQEDKENTLLIQGLLHTYDVFQETIANRIKELKEIRTFNYDVMSEIINLELAAQKRRQQVSDNIDKIKAKRIIIEDQMYQYQCQINQLLHECKILRKGKIRTLLLDRRATHRHHMMRIMEIGEFRSEVDKTVHEALNYYKIYEVGKKEALRLVDIHKEHNLIFLMNMNDMDRLHIEKCHNQDLYNTKLERRLPPGLKELSRDEKRIKKETKEANRKIFDLKRGINSLKIYSPELDEEIICKQYDDLEQENFSRVKRICEIEETTLMLRQEMFDTATSIQTSYKSLDSERKEKNQNLLKVQAFSEYLTEEMGNQEIKLNLDDDSSFAVVSAIMDSFGILCGFSEILREFLDKRVTKSNLDLLFHLMEQRIGEYKYEKNYLEIRKNVEIKGGALPKKTGPVNQGYPVSSGGPYIPDIFIPNTQISVTEEVDDIINSLARLHPIDEQEAIMLAVEELHRMRAVNQNNEAEEERRLSDAVKKQENEAEEKRKSILRREVLKKTLATTGPSIQAVHSEDEEGPDGSTAGEEAGPDPEV